jgi:hypothetical protein
VGSLSSGYQVEPAASYWPSLPFDFMSTAWSVDRRAAGTSSGGVVPWKLMFVKENGAWKIYGIQKADGWVAERAELTDYSGEVGTSGTREALDAGLRSWDSRSMSKSSQRTACESERDDGHQ